MSDRQGRIYDTRWGWLLPSGVSWKLGRKPSLRRAILAVFLNPLDFGTYRVAEALSKHDKDGSALE